MTYRISGSDFTNAIAWQTRTRASDPRLANVRLELAFNGEGASGIYSPDTLTPAVVAGRTAFNWVSHTYTHQNLDSVTYNVARRELVRNDRTATLLGLSPYQKDALVQPDISGLGNPQFLQAAKDFGIKYLISDTSRPGGATPTPNAGFYTTSQPSILVVQTADEPLLQPRDSGAVRRRVQLPLRAGWALGLRPRDLTYSEIVDHESDNLLSYLLTWTSTP